MSPQRQKILLVLAVTLVVPGVALLLVFGDHGYDRPKTDQGESPQPLLIARAIEAMGGKERLSRIRSIRSRGHGFEGGRKSDIQISIVLPDQYRHDIRTSDAHLVHGSDGKATWSTIDGVLVPVADDDVVRLKEQMALVRCGLLVGLDAQDVEIEWLGLKDSREWIRVTLADAGAGPFDLGFSVGSSLLTRIEWKTRRAGNFFRSDFALEFSDYREEDGVMVAYTAAFQVDDKELGQETLEEVAFDIETTPALFEKPEATDENPVILRKSTGLPIAYLDHVPSDAEDAEVVLNAFVKEFDLERNGPTFRTVEDERAVAVGVPVRQSNSAKTVPVRPQAPRLHRTPSQMVLTTIVKDPDAEVLRKAHDRLMKEASQRSLDVAGPFRHVSWKETIVQVQLPVKDR